MCIFVLIFAKYKCLILIFGYSNRRNKKPEAVNEILMLPCIGFTDSKEVPILLVHLYTKVKLLTYTYYYKCRLSHY